MNHSARTINLLQIGVGQVGGTLVRQILAQHNNIKASHSLDLTYCGLFAAEGGLFAADGLPAGQVAAFPRSADLAISAADCIDRLTPPFIVIDATASPKTLPLLQQALALGGSVVAVNKQPFAASQADFDHMKPYIGRRLFFETTVGAGLPVLGPLGNLLSSGDEVLEIQGCFSGTLGYLFSQMESGRSFSGAVAEAKRLGFTEPNPREDLSGADVARKALILARLLGSKLELSDIPVEKLYPAQLETLEVSEFMAALTTLDADYAHQIAEAAHAGQVRRYIATVTPHSINVGLQSVERTSDIGTLSGPDNIVVIKTGRYLDHPLVIKGPGAGPDVTAAGIFGDVLLAASQHD